VRSAFPLDFTAIFPPDGGNRRVAQDLGPTPDLCTFRPGGARLDAVRPGRQCRVA
jgi:hypothetical protein